MPETATRAAREPLDYIRRLNGLSEDLLRSHGELLGRKNVWRKQQLIRAIRLDLDKLTHALVEAKENQARSVLGTFFGDVDEDGTDLATVDISSICDRLSDRRIYHVGFEIHEPIALVLYGIRHWIEHSRQALKVHMAVRDYLHFPASEAFRKRVGAYAEIMRIWLEVDDRVLMLELFDIERPADSLLAAAPQLTHRNFHPLFGQNEAGMGHPDRLARLFAADEIWHYAFHAKSPADVRELHGELQAIAAQRGAFSMAYSAPVHNTHDRSFHTKIIRRGEGGRGRLELEFVTEFDG